MSLDMTFFVWAAIAALLGVVAYSLRRWPARIRRYMREIQAGALAARETHALLAVAAQRLGEAKPPRIEGEASVFSGGRWECVGGAGLGWPADTFYKVRGLAVLDSDLYASLTGPRQDGPLGEVWRLSAEKWRRIGGGDTGPWPAPSSVDHLFVYAGRLLVAERGGVWQFADERWTPLSQGLDFDDKCGPYCFAEWGDRVVMGQWGQPRVAVLGEDGRWSYLPTPDDGWGKGARTIYCLLSWRGHLYAATGTGKLTGPGATVWRYDGTSWEKVGGSGLRGSWSQAGIPFVLSLCEFDNRLVATVSRPTDTPSGVSNVWAFDGDRWGALAVGAAPRLMEDSLIMNDAIVFDGRLVVATGHSDRQAAQLWELGAGSRWQPVGPVELAQPGSGEGGWWVYRLCAEGRHLYAATAGHRGAAHVFRFRAQDSI